MNRSYSKIRHIQESNNRLEKRLLKEQNTPSISKEQQEILDEHVKKLKQSGYKVVDKIPLPDGDYDLSGAGYTCFLIKDRKDTGYVYVTTSGIRGSWLGRKINISGGELSNVLSNRPVSMAPQKTSDVYKILFNSSVVGQTVN